MKYKHVCPLCKGKGMIYRDFKSRFSYSFETKKKVANLYAKGLSLREIALKMKLKHPQTVQNLMQSYYKMVKSGEFK